jgi:hypothetical protein
LCLALVSGSLLLGFTATAQAAGELDVTMSDAHQLDPATLVAGRPVTLVGSVHFWFSSRGCEAKDLAGRSLSATVTLMPPVSILGGTPSTQTVDVPTSYRATSATNPPVMNVRWRVLIGAPGAYDGRLEVSARSVAGSSCEGSQDFKIAAVSDGPRFRVFGGYINRRDGLVVAYRTVLPGLAAGLFGAFDDALEQLHPSSEEAVDVPGSKDVVKVWRGKRRLQSWSALTSNGGEQWCVQLIGPRGFRGGTLRYRLSFYWNREKGFPVRREDGHFTVRDHPTNRGQRLCAQWFAESP